MAQDGVQWSDLALAVSVPERQKTRQLRSGSYGVNGWSIRSLGEVCTQRT